MGVRAKFMDLAILVSPIIGAGGRRHRMNVIVQLGLAAHKKAPEKNLQFTYFFSFFAREGFLFDLFRQETLNVMLPKDLFNFNISLKFLIKI